MVKAGWIIVIGCLLWVIPGISAAGDKPSTKQPRKQTAVKAADIATAVKAASAQDCGCGECASKGCKPCHGKNCYYCVAKGLVTNECGCGKCSSKGCDDCGPGCDVCKFHLAPVGKAKNKTGAS